MSELRELSAFRPARLPSIPESVGVVTTPLQLRAWEVELKGHPDGEYSFWTESDRGFASGTTTPRTRASVPPGT